MWLLSSLVITIAARKLVRMCRKLTVVKLTACSRQEGCMHSKTYTPEFMQFRLSRIGRTLPVAVDSMLVVTAISSQDLHFPQVCEPFLGEFRAATQAEAAEVQAGVGAPAAAAATELIERPLLARELWKLAKVSVAWPKDKFICKAACSVNC